MCWYNSQELYQEFFLNLYVEFTLLTSITIKGTGFKGNEFCQWKHESLTSARKSTDNGHDDDDDDDKVGKVYLRAKWPIRPELILVSTQVSTLFIILITYYKRITLTRK